MPQSQSDTVSIGCIERTLVDVRGADDVAIVGGNKKPRANDEREREVRPIVSFRDSL
jgi:hypothetical protein